MWKYYAFKFAEFFLSYLPKKVGYLIARIVADAVYILSPSLRAVVADNVRHVLAPEADDATLKRTVRGVFRNVARNYFDLVKMPHMKLSDIEGSLITHGWHNVDGAVKRGKGVILVTAHLGSFDVAAQILGIRLEKITILVEPLEPAALLDHVIALRESKGLTFMPVRLGVLRIVIQSLHRGEVVLFACDRDFAKDGLITNFFGEETTMPAGAVRIAMRTGAAIVPAFNLRRGDGRYDVYFEPAIEIVPGGDEAVLSNIDRIVSVMEKYIKKCPEQWVVLSPIWSSEQ